MIFQTESEEMQQHDSNKTTYEQIRVLTVNNGEHLDGILYRLKKGVFKEILFILFLFLYNFILFKLSLLYYTLLF